MPIRRTVTEVARNFSDYINRVLFRRERFVLLRGNRPVAELRPVNVGVPLADLPALFASFPHLDPNDAAEFEKDLETGRAELDTLPINDPWQR
jgi:hypothetical protein